MADEYSGRGRHIERLKTLIGAEAYHSQKFAGYPKAPGQAPASAPAPPPTGRIVVGVDGSATSVAALRWAAEEAGRRDASLLAVAAYRQELPILPPFGAVTDAARTARDTLSRAIRDAGVRNVETLVVEGAPATRLLQLTRDADLLVVATHGHSRAGAALLGSVSMQCVGRAACPVVVVPAPGPDR
ncbi:universal stress protein [Frankia sp. Cppng1_Ct_nod]|uniref:universal stress protein n=1 Tax=Frankia sp. Cppng1_Ct_nod TaxID=2897162 RepID=UPI001041B6AA|nr:universal stress protein [Frankia sp. Cppng1_Ct_nod]